MGALLSSKKTENMQMNYFLFENYNKFLKIDSNLIDIDSLPENIEALGSSFSVCCCNFKSSSDWKDHFIERTETLKDKFPWVKEMRSFIKKSSLGKDELFLSKFSWKMFIALNKPNVNSEQLSATNLEFSSTSCKSNCILIERQPIIEIKKRKRTISSSSKSSTKKSKNGQKPFLQNSLFSSRADLLADRKEMQKNYNFINNLYRVMTDELEKHLNEKLNGLSALKFHFVSHLLKTLDALTEATLTKECIENILTGFKVFIKIFTECMMVFYKLEETAEYIKKTFKSQSTAFKFDNFLVFVTNLFFTEEIFDKILDLQRNIFDKEEEAVYIEKLEKLKEKNIEDFEVPVQFTLNENTAKQILKKSYRSSPFSPYETLINSLKNIEILKSPFFQFKSLTTISESISNEINEFYENFQNNCNENVDTDTLISLHIFIIVKSGVKNLISLLNLMERFSSEKQKMELPGYYLTLYRASIEFIKGIQI